MGVIKMGYSVYVDAENKEQQEKMYDFLQKNIRHLTKEIFKVDQPLFNVAKGTSDEKNGLSYTRNDVKFPVGFNYNSCIASSERIYLFEVIKLVSKKITKEKTFFYYDGQILKIEERSIEDIKRFLKQFSMARRKTRKQILKFILLELERLDFLWDKCFYFRKHGDYHSHEICENCPWVDTKKCPNN